MTSPLASSAWAALELVGNHLWQSTLFATVAGLLTLVCRRNRAQVRYGLWLAASVKFLIPFGSLVAMGQLLSWRSSPAVLQPQFTFVMDTISQPLSGSVAPIALAPTPTPNVATMALPIVLLAVWFVGSMFWVARWWIGWRRMKAVVERGLRIDSGREWDLLRQLEATGAITTSIRLVSCHEGFEPGVFGIRRPILLWPLSLSSRLTDAQVEALLAHEVCHVRRRDNLTATMHMAVEALFWFYPLVWWVGARLVDERERACDQDVLAFGNEPEAYAESILKTCEYYVESPLTCVAGVTGADLKKRIEAIMRNHVGTTLSRWRKLLLVAVGVAAIVGPLVVGALNAPRLRAQSSTDNGKPLAFEVASIKPNKSGEKAAGIEEPPGRFTAINVPLGLLITYAYQISDNQLLSAPEWTRTERFDITAQLDHDPPAAQPSEPGERRLALRTLLAERFKLAVKRDTRELPMYALVMARADRRPGPMLTRSSTDCSHEGMKARLAAGQAGNPVSGFCGSRFNTGRILFGGFPLSEFAKRFSPYDGRSVIDRTGLTGNWDFELTFAPDQLGPPRSGQDAPVVDPNLPSLPTAMQEQLGLKLEPTRGSVEVLVVDHVEQPTDNSTEPAAPAPRSSTQAQLPTAPAKDHPAFAAASVKPNKSGSPVLGIAPQPGGRFTATNMSLGQLLRSAYGIPMFRLVGGPGWIESERFDVVATAGYSATFNEMRFMMQTLLAERFKLKVHAESQEQPVFELVTARRDGRLGPNLRRSEVDCTGKDWPNALLGSAPPQCGFIGPDPENPISSGRSRFAVRGTSMEAFSLFLQGAGSRHVFNRTGLSGFFDGEFDFTAEMGPPAPPDRTNLPSIFTVVQEQLGLKLEATRGPVEVLVIDSVDRPTPD